MENQNKKLRQKILLWAGILFAQIILFYIFSKSEWVLYVHQHFFEYQKYLHQWFFAWADISIGDVCYIVLGILLAAVATLGDLVESTIKRHTGIKDSGSLIPGHGGVLDRFDSIMFTVPLVYYYVQIFNIIG